MFFVSTVTFNSVTVNWRRQADSTRQIGLEIELKEVLIVDVGCSTVGEICVSDDFYLRKSEMFLLLQSHSAVLQQIEDDRRIRLVK